MDNYPNNLIMPKFNFQSHVRKVKMLGMTKGGLKIRTLNSFRTFVPNGQSLIENSKRNIPIISVLSSIFCFTKSPHTT